MKQITEEMKRLLDEPLPAEAIKQHPSKKFLSTIKSIYVTERLNNVFGVGEWNIKTEFITAADKMVVCKTILEIPEYGIYYECFGGNDNADLGDAFKGATTDAITKIGSWLGIGANIWKDIKEPVQPQQAAAKQPVVSDKKVPQNEEKAPQTEEQPVTPEVKDLMEKIIGAKNMEELVSIYRTSTCKEKDSQKIIALFSEKKKCFK